jgi:hypothetical protein
MSAGNTAIVVVRPSYRRDCNHQMDSISDRFWWEIDIGAEMREFVRSTFAVAIQDPRISVYVRIRKIGRLS